MKFSRVSICLLLTLASWGRQHALSQQLPEINKDGVKMYAPDKPFFNVTLAGTCTGTGCGTAGPAGATGATGAAGSNGSNGVSSLVQLAAVRVADEPLRNLVDPTKGTAGSALNPSTGATVGGFGSDWVTGYIPANAGGTMTANLTLSPDGATDCFYDQDKNFQSCDQLSTRTPGTVVSIPSSAGYIRFNLNGAADLSGTAMVVNGSTLPGAYVAFVPVTTASVAAAISAAVAALTPGEVSPITGKRVAFWGDSICQTHGTAWIPIMLANTGTTQSFEDCHGGRAWSGFFEDYGNNGATGTESTVSGSTNTGTPGNTVAQDLATTDILVIELGTNFETIGTAGSTTGGTLYGDVHNVLTTLHTALPALRIVLLAPYANIQWSFDNTPTGNLVPTTQAIQYDAAEFSDPVLAMANAMGINAFTEGYNGTSDTLNTYLVDGTHINALGGARMGRIVAEFLKQQSN